MQRPLFFQFCLIAVVLCGLSPSEGSELKITKIPSNCGYVETARVSYYHGKIYVGGWLKPHYWMSGNKIYVKVDLKNAAGKVVATKTDYAYATGRPQCIEQFGVPYVVSFDASQVTHLAAIDVYYIN
jgi:hypothetical protein